MKRSKVFLIDSPGFGGSEIDFLERAGVLIEDGDLIILSTLADARFLEGIQKTKAKLVFKEPGNRLVNVFSSLLFFFRRIWKIRKSVFVFWLHHADSNRWMQLLLAFFKCKFILVERSMPQSEGSFRKSKLSLPVKRFAANRSVQNIVCGVDQVAYFRTLYGTSKVMAIPNARKIDSIREVADKYRSKNSHEITGARNIVTIGRLCDLKDQEGIIKAVALLGAAYNVKLYVVGDGENREPYQELIKDLNLDNVMLTGYDPEPIKWLALADVFILNSRLEGLPGVLIEAMAAGVPCIATDIRGNRELVKHEGTGLLVPENAPADLAAAIKRLLTDNQLAKAVAENAFENVQKNYSYDREVFLWTNLIQSLA